MMSHAAKNFLQSCLSVLHNYFESPIKLCLADFLDISTKSSFQRIMNELSKYYPIKNNLKNN